MGHAKQAATRMTCGASRTVDPESVSTDAGDEIAGTRGDDWRGLYRFKTGFGGEIVTLSAGAGAPVQPGRLVCRAPDERGAGRGSDT